MAVWGNNQVVVLALTILLVGQFGVIIRSIPTRIRGVYVKESGCVMASAETDPVSVLYIVTMVVDFVILLLTVYKTYVEYRDMYHSGLIRLIFRDGLAYFAVVFVANLVALVRATIKCSQTSGALNQAFIDFLTSQSQPFRQYNGVRSAFGDLYDRVLSSRPSP
ncbi:hypothetical protein PM082_014884 [Marasmius tenuissimus]|nr:hypothetical protein PM082_014884 [Marasmius tenuissimus]